MPIFKVRSLFGDGELELALERYICISSVLPIEGSLIVLFFTAFGVNDAGKEPLFLDGL